jgi:O-acetylhomoserine/O-acetylserine sulfhydrylase-like pyridoxal-dependent enzyme
MNKQISTADCEFRKEDKTLLVSHRLVKDGFPVQIDVVSSHTGKIVTFKVDQEAAEAAEFWDGEECHYVPVTEVPNVRRLVIHCAF